MNTPAHILICDDNPVYHQYLQRSLSPSFKVTATRDGDEALKALKEQSIDLMLLDIQLRSPTEGIQYIPKFLAADPDLTIVMISATTDFRTFRDAMRLGAVDYIAKDFDADEIQHTLKKALERRGLLKKTQQQNFETLTHQRQNLLLGNSKAMQDLRRRIEKVRESTTHVIIHGETGTGKELVARQLRKTLTHDTIEPFVAIDSSTIQSTMAESILFGHEKGAFTGADRTTKGIFEEAHQGIVYFDELANMPLEIQAKLLRVIQEKEVKRLGSSRTIKLDFRVICATNRDLEKMATEGQFKEDLYQRLNVIPIQIPPLRERTEDIPLLVDHFLKRQSHPSQPLQMSDEALEALMAYPWPGNVRELENTIAYIATLFDGEKIEVADLPPKLRESIRKKAKDKLAHILESDCSKPFYQRVEEFERDLLTRELTQHQGSLSKLAVSLGMDRSHLYTKMKEFGIRPSKTGQSGQATPNHN